MTLALIHAGANVNFGNYYDVTPLHTAAEWGKIKMTKVLLYHHAAVNIINKDKDTPLHCAVRSPNATSEASLIIAKLLLSQGADVNKTNRDGKTPIDIAIERGNKEMIELLESHISNVHCKSPSIGSCSSLGNSRNSFYASPQGLGGYCIESRKLGLD